MAVKTVYQCQDCGAESGQWSGQCKACGQWNTLVEGVQVALSKAVKAPRYQGYAGAETSSVVQLAQVSQQAHMRLSTGLSEFDRVLGGGVVAGAVVLLGGDPGIGKSTLLLQTVCQLAAQHRVLYISGEESPEQVSMRAQRLQLPKAHVHLLADTQVERIIAMADQVKPEIMVIDSIQTMYSELLGSAPGSVGQLRESAAQLVRYAKQMHVALFLVGHVTKEGALAGPRVLEHMVDGVLYFEGDRSSRFRLLRAVKNRFGAVNELGIFAMTDRGLKQVANPSALFLSGHEKPAAGRMVMVTWEGSRPLLVEVQALVCDSHLPQPRRLAVGLEQNRLALLLAVLQRHGGVLIGTQDVFVNVVGGLRVAETAIDLPLLLAVHSSLKDKVMPVDWAAFGEVGLSGEIRPVQSGIERINEAQKHGFKRLIMPKANLPKSKWSGIDLIGVESLSEALCQIDD